METSLRVPTHIGYIVDGNRRWAKQLGLPAYEGHLAGYNTAKDIVKATVNAGVKYVSLYLFSTENWKRDGKEVSKLMSLVHRLITSDLGELIEAGVRVRFAGTHEGLTEKIMEDMEVAKKKTEHLTNGTLIVCFNYGGQREIADAVRGCLSDGLLPDEIDEDAIARHLYVADVPPCDIIVRTGGEQRLSNFQLWRSAYSELLFLEKFWPDLNQGDVTAIIDIYNKRQRRFGS